MNSVVSKYLKFFVVIGNTIIPRNFSTMKKERTWKVLRVNHLAIASANFEKSVHFFRDVLGIETSPPIPMPEHGVTTAFLGLENVELELLDPLGEKSPIANFLQRNASGGMHHICLDVDNIENAIEDLKERNIRTLTKGSKIGAHGKPVIFIHPKDCCGVLIELQQA